MAEFDPTAPFCAFCYKQPSTSTSSSEDERQEDESFLKTCSKCHNRQYCSRKCQADDWRTGHHKLFCGKVGEVGVDYEIRPVDSKGLGVFAKRHFQRNDTILVERPVVKSSSLSSIPEDENVQRAILALTPTKPGSTFTEKYKRNNVGQLCLNFSRVNHDCIGNSHHAFDDEKDLLLLVASRTIPKGEEISYSYTFLTPHAHALAKHTFCWNFTCECRACKCPDVAHKLDLMIEYDKQVVAHAKNMRMEEGTKTALKLIELYDEFQSSSYLYSRIYTDLYHMAITKRETFEQGMKYIKLAFEHGIGFFGYDSELVRKKRHDMNHPIDSMNYLILE